MKRVLSDTGHQTSIMQRTFDLEARGKDEASQLAKTRFCNLEGIQDWSSHADDLVIEEADFPS
jgi:hypothetical protein